MLLIELEYIQTKESLFFVCITHYCDTNIRVGERGDLSPKVLKQDYFFNVFFLFVW